MTSVFHFHLHTKHATFLIVVYASLFFSPPLFLCYGNISPEDGRMANEINLHEP
ncbi:hypothetical protein ACSS6W_008624 [Trichoderma asperelloides]